MTAYVGGTMRSYALVVSNPPHGEVDPSQAAPAMGLAAAEIRTKANYPAPEIWLADTDRDKMAAAAAALGDAGLTVVVVTGEDLLNVPKQVPVTSFEFTDMHLVAQAEGSEVRVAYDAPVTAVLCTPAGKLGESGSGAGGSSLTEGLRLRSSSVFMTRDSLVGFGGLGTRSSAAGAGREEGAQKNSHFLDIYFTGESGPGKISVTQDQVDFSGLGKSQTPDSATNLALFAAKCEDRFAQGRFDRRLVNMQARQWPMVSRGIVKHGERKGYSYATEALSKLLESISPDLKDLSPFQFSSVLAYLTWR